MAAKEGFDASFLVGKELVQICFGQFDLQFHFHPDTNLTVFHTLQLTGSCRQIWKHGQILESTVLTRLVGQPVAKVTIEPADGLRIQFLSGDAIETFTQSNYKSYTLNGIVV
jgi:hypothetical protein